MKVYSYLFNKPIYFLLLALFCWNWPGLESRADTFNAVKNSQATSVIIVPDNAWPVQKLAAEELQYHLQKISGASVKIFPEAQIPGNMGDIGQIHLGKTRQAMQVGLYKNELPTNAYQLATVDNRLFIAGKDTKGEALDSLTGAGTLFGVYDLLEKQLGVRWLWPGEIGSVIPQSHNITFDISANRDQIYRTAKDFSLWRAPYASGAPATALKGWQSQTAGETYYLEQAKWLRRHRFGIGTETKLIKSDKRVFHTFLEYWAKYGQEHPDYFNLLADGTRREHPGRKRGGPGVTLCVSNPALHRQIVEDWSKSWRGKMNTHLLLGENDSPALCTCANCRSWDALDVRFETSKYWGKKQMFEELSPFLISDVAGNSTRWGWHGKLGADTSPSLSDRYARFYLEVQREAQKDHPDVEVSAFAYLNYWQAPKKPIQLNERIIIAFVPPTRVPYTAELSQEIRQNWDGWRKTGAKLYLRPNLPTSHNAPMSFMRRFAQDLKYFSATGLIGSDYDSLNRGHFGTQGTSLYAIARINSDPHISPDNIMKEYCSAFGKAAPLVQKYFEYWEKVSEREVEIGATGDMIGVVGDAEAQERDLSDVATWVKLYHFTFTPLVMQRGRQLMDEIKDHVPAHATEKQRVQYLEDAFRETELTAQVIDTFIQFHKTGQKDGALKAQFKQQYQNLLQYRATLEPRFVGDYGARQSAENFAFKSIQ